MAQKDFKDLLPKNFFEPETRCEYTISSEMKKVWAIQLELLYTFKNVCEEHGLKYWLIGGSLLGAIRHKGFIPWDDDIDVVMMRDDYEVLCSNPSWFKGELLLHMSSNKERYYEGWARIHNTNTAILYPNYEKAGSKQGIYIDVIPLDYATPKDLKKYKKIKRLNVLGHSISYNANSNILLRTVAFFNSLFYVIKPEKIYKKVNKLAIGKERTDVVRTKVCPMYAIEKQTYKTKDFENTIQVPFEFFDVAVPAGYDSVLKDNFGDYSKFPPKEKRGTWHLYSFSTEKSYEDF